METINSPTNIGASMAVNENLDNIEYRLQFATVLTDLLKKDKILALKKIDETVSTELESFLRKQLTILLMEIMGERNTSVPFSDEESQIIKLMVQRVKTTFGGTQ